MNDSELLELRQILKAAFENNDWTSVEDAIDFINEYVDADDDIEFL